MKASTLVLVCLVVCLSCTKINNISLAKVKTLKPFTAVIEEVHFDGVRGADSSSYLAVEITLRERNGKLVVIKEPQLNLTQLAFASSLIQGKSYEFPEAITYFEADLKMKRSKRQSGGKINSPGGI